MGRGQAIQREGRGHRRCKDHTPTHTHTPAHAQTVLITTVWLLSNRSEKGSLTMSLPRLFAFAFALVESCDQGLRRGQRAANGGWFRGLVLLLLLSSEQPKKGEKGGIVNPADRTHATRPERLRCFISLKTLGQSAGICVAADKFFFQA